MLDVDHLDIDPRNIMVFIYQSGRRLVESGQKIAFERATTLSEPFVTLSFCDLKNEKSCVKERKMNCLHLKTEDKKTDIAILLVYDT